MEIVSISDKQELLKHKFEINRLFSECFAQRNIGDLWDWAYIKNPNNVPIVTLCYEENRLVGHYAIMSMPLWSGNAVINSYLSMTTMVAQSHRKYGLFQKLAADTYETAAKLGVDFIIGFPNVLSTPGFKKRLNWVLPPTDYVARITKEQLFGGSSISMLLSKKAYKLNLHDQKTLMWRMSKPGAKYFWNDGLLFKEFNDSIDIMYFDNEDDLKKIPDGKYINILIGNENTQLRDSMIFEYQFGGVRINKEFVPSIINRQMCLSDVF
jgi:hypothetical protein